MFVSWYDCGGVLHSQQVANRDEANALRAKLREAGNCWVTVGKTADGAVASRG